MLQTVRTSENGVTVRATVRALAVYLDNHSIITLAKGDSGRRQRFIRCLESGVDLLFSSASTAEILGPLGDSRAAVQSFLDEVGPNWFPVDSDLIAVMQREASGADRSSSAMATELLRQFFASRHIQESGEQRLELVPPEFFRLGFVVDWLSTRRDHIRIAMSEFDAQLGGQLAKLSAARSINPGGFEAVLPSLKYDASKPATFTYYGLVRQLAIEARSHGFKQGDAADFMHAVMGASFATHATLDKHWKRRIESLPQPNGLAKIYYGPQLSELVSDVETDLSRLRTG